VETDPERLVELMLGTCNRLAAVQNLDYPKMATLMNNAVLIDGRNFLDRRRIATGWFLLV